MIKQVITGIEKAKEKLQHFVLDINKRGSSNMEREAVPQQHCRL